MSDLRFVCVRSDLHVAEALADIFEDAGFTIADGEGEARVALILWSDAAERSRAFADAARRAADQGRSILISTVPVQAHVVGRLVFDLSGWTGDGAAAAIDPLFAAVDRAVFAAERATVVVEPAPAELAIAEIEIEVVEPEPEAPAAVIALKPRPRARARGAFVRNSVAALALLMLGVGGAWTASFAFTTQPVAAPARIEVMPENASPLPEPAFDALEHVRFADIVLDEPIADEPVVELAAASVAPRGIEPPSADSQSRTPAPYMSWRDASTEAPSAPVVSAYAQTETGGPLDLTAPIATAAPAKRSKPNLHV